MRRTWKNGPQDMNRQFIENKMQMALSHTMHSCWWDWRNRHSEKWKILRLDNLLITSKIKSSSFNQTVSLLRFYLRCTGKIWNDVCTKIFGIALFVTAKDWKPPKSPLRGDWQNKWWYVHMMEYCTAVKRQEDYLYNSGVISRVEEVKNRLYGVLPIV